MDKRKFTAEIVAVYFGYAIRYLYPLVLVPFLGRVLGVDSYGVVLAGLSLSGAVWLFLAFGFPIHGVREIARDPSPAVRAEVFGNQCTARLLLLPWVLIGGGVAVACSPALGSHPLVGFAAVAVGVLNAFNLGWYFSATDRPRTTVALEVLGLAWSATGLLCWVRTPADVPWVFLLLFSAAVVQQLAAYAMAWRELHGQFGRWRWGAALQLIRESRDLFFYSNAPTASATASTYLLSVFSAPAVVGAFGVAERVTSAVIGLLNPAGQVLIPHVTRLYETNPRQAWATVGRLLGVVLALVVAIVLALWWGASALIHLLVGAGYEQAASLLRLFVWVIPVSVVNQFLAAYVIVPTRRERFLAKVAAFGALACVMVGMLAAPWLGAVAMIAARLITELGMFGMLGWPLVRSFRAQMHE